MVELRGAQHPIPTPALEGEGVYVVSGLTEWHEGSPLLRKGNLYLTGFPPVPRLREGDRE